MKINVIVGNNFKDVNQTVIRMIDFKNFKFQNYIIVPDRSSLLIEKLVFDTLEITSTLNISVMGISRLASQIFEKLGKNFEIISKQESLLILRTAIINLKPRLKFFKNSEISVGLCEELFETITQLKSNEITPEGLKKSNELLNKKDDLFNKNFTLEDRNILNQKKKNISNFNSTLFNSLISQVSTQKSFPEKSNQKNLKPEKNDRQKVEINETNSIIFDKIYDIILIYGAYENLLKDKVDSTRVLTLLEEAIFQNANKLNLINSNFFFLNFDSLTKQGYSILKVLTTTAKSVCVGALQPNFQRNSYIFENDIFEKLKKLSISENIELNLITTPCTLKKSSLLIHKNLYSLKIDNDLTKDSKSDFVEIFEAPEISEEIFEVARKITHMIKFEKVKFKQIAIACGDLSMYAEQIENVFQEFNFSYYLDTNTNLNETVTIDYLLLILKMLEKNFSKDLLERFFSHEFTKLSEQGKYQLLDLIEKFNLQADDFFKFFESFLMKSNAYHNCELKSFISKIDKNSLKNTEIKSKYEKISKLQKEIENLMSKNNLKDISKTATNTIESPLDFLELHDKIKKFTGLKTMKKTCKSGYDYIKLIKYAIEQFKIIEHNDNIIIEFNKRKFFKDEKIYLQIPEKLNHVLSSIEKLLTKQNLTYAEFIEIFESFLLSVKLSTVPISVDSIFIGDATNSFFDEIDFLFVLGANQGLIPRTLNDDGIFDDGLIAKCSPFIEINPTVKMINRRNRFKIFNLLLLSSQKIFVSYVLANESQDKLFPSKFVFDLQKIFLNNSTIKKSSDYIQFLSTFSEENIEHLCRHLAYFCANKRNALHQLLKLKYQYGIFAKINKSLLDGLEFFLNSEILERNFNYLNDFKIDNSLILALMNSKIAVTQIENYYSCPFKQFASNLLKLKEKDVAELKPIDTGNVLHKIAEEFLKQKNRYIENLKIVDNDNEEFKRSVKNIVNQIFNNLKKDNRFYKLRLQINQNAVELLKRESERLCEFLFYTQTISKFKPTFLELRFGRINEPHHEDCQTRLNSKNLNAVVSKHKILQKISRSTDLVHEFSENFENLNVSHFEKSENLTVNHSKNSISNLNCMIDLKSLKAINVDNLKNLENLNINSPEVLENSKRDTLQNLEDINENNTKNLNNSKNLDISKILGNDNITNLENLKVAKSALATSVSNVAMSVPEIEKNSIKIPNKLLVENIEIGGKKISLSGIIDRVDTYKDMFIVIDYKSGAENSGGYSEVFYGEKIQIFVYLKVLEKLLNKKPYGAFYFPIKNEYSSQSKNYMMKGKAVENIKFLNAMDTSLGINNLSSKIFPCKINASKKNLITGEKEFSKIYTVSEKVLNSMIDYSFCLLKLGASEILKGNISPSPQTNGCKFCKFSSLCLYNKKHFRGKIYEIKKSFFEEF